MQQMGFGDRLAKAVQFKKNPVCVGLDPRLEQLPNGIRVESSVSLENQADAFERFCRDVIDAIHDLVPVVKPQSAFFEELGPYGVLALGRVCEYASSKGLIVIMDAKRNDIGSTATAYAKAYLGTNGQSAWGTDALTASPYLGSDALEPFVDQCTASGAGISVRKPHAYPAKALFVVNSEYIIRLEQSPRLTIGNASDVSLTPLH